jgi:hypothetical protein
MKHLRMPPECPPPQPQTPHYLLVKVQPRESVLLGFTGRHMAGTDDMQAVFVDDNGKEIWPCRYCFEKDINKSSNSLEEP